VESRDGRGDERPDRRRRRPGAELDGRGASARWRLAAAGFEVEIEAAKGAETIAASVRRWAAAMAS
jgi:hypothetical protein